MSALFNSKRDLFDRNNEAFKDMVQGRMAMDVEVAIKTTAGTPVKTGAMKSDVRHFKNEKGGWRVEAGKEYSAVQEAGRRLSGQGAKQFSHYTTAGTKYGWFKRAIDSVTRRKDTYILEARRAINQ
jgi:hypothetical protein